MAHGKAAGKGSSKRTKVFKKKHLKKTIEDRRKRQGVKKQREAREFVKQRKAGKRKNQQGGEEEEDEVDPDAEDDVLGLSDEASDAEDVESGEDDAAAEEEGEGSDDEEVDDDLENFDAEEEKHKISLEALKKSDPEFYEYLKKNDEGLLEFGNDHDEDEEIVEKVRSKKGKAKKQEEPEDEDEEEEEEEDESEDQGPVLLTMQILKSMQVPILEKRSLIHHRKLLLAFKSAVYENESDASELKFAVKSPKVFNKLITTVLKYTPAVFNHHVPTKELPNGRLKVSSEKKNYGLIQRLLKSYINSLCQLLKISSDVTTLATALTESSKLAGYMVGNRLVAKQYLKTVLDIFTTTTDDKVRLGCVFALHKLARSADPGMLEMILKNSYIAFVRTCKRTTIHTMSKIEFMKNGISDLYLLNQGLSYQIAFGYIRQLAIHLRSTLKLKTKESFSAIHNWQFVHGIDFWSLVLSRLCQKTSQEGTESVMQPLIYPLVQVALGAVRLLPLSKTMPFRFNIIRSLNKLSERTGVYVPLSSYLVEVLDSNELKQQANHGKNNKASSGLKPLDMELQLRAPERYLRTQVYSQGVLEEFVYLLLEHLTAKSTSIVFPELSTPVTMRLRRYVKQAKGQGPGSRKAIESLKTLIDKIEANRKLIEDKRKDVEFGPDKRTQVDDFNSELEVSKTPLGTFMRLQKKNRDAKREMLEKAAFEEDDVRDNKKEDSDDMEEDLDSDEVDENSDEDEEEEMESDS